MLEQIAKHGKMFLSLNCKGDYDVDDHHSIEDIAICLGTAIKKALGSKIAIERYGFLLPMDESLATVAIDLSGRPHIDFAASFQSERIGGLSTQMIEHFFQCLAFSLEASLHMTVREETIIIRLRLCSRHWENVFHKPLHLATVELFHLQRGSYDCSCRYWRS